jgi:hypothetical protein
MRRRALRSGPSCLPPRLTCDRVRAIARVGGDPAGAFWGRSVQDRRRYGICWICTPYVKTRAPDTLFSLDASCREQAAETVCFACTRFNTGLWSQAATSTVIPGCPRPRPTPSTLNERTHGTGAILGIEEHRSPQRVDSVGRGGATGRPAQRRLHRVGREEQPIRSFCDPVAEMHEGLAGR